MRTDIHGISGAFRTILARLRRSWAEADRTAGEQAPEATRIQAALDMHELGVRLYRQRMYREHPHAERAEINGMVRAWLAEPPRSTHLRLPSRERDRGLR
jgi:Rv0078B-related antitoxin